MSNRRTVEVGTRTMGRGVREEPLYCLNGALHDWRYTGKYGAYDWAVYCTRCLLMLLPGEVEQFRKVLVASPKEGETNG